MDRIFHRDFQYKGEHGRHRRRRCRARWCEATGRLHVGRQAATLPARRTYESTLGPFPYRRADHPPFNPHIMFLAARQNRLLAALPDVVLRGWLPRLELVEMTRGQELCGAGEVPAHAYFPTTAIVSLLHPATSEPSAEMALAGREGVIGLPIFMGRVSSSGAAVVLCAGWGFRLDAKFLQDECHREPAVLAMLLRFAQAVLMQVAQTAICTRRHSLRQQLCRRLLLCLDRTESNDLAMTHKQIAALLAVRRGGVTECALHLQHMGVIRYSRGLISVIDRPALEQQTCRCYADGEHAFQRLLVPF